MIQFVRMSEEHVLQIADLELQCFSAPWSKNAISGELTNPLSYWLVALYEDKVVGYVGSQAVLGEADMMNLAVLPDYRRKGVARGLVEALIKNLELRDVYSLTLEVRQSNFAALSLYESLGFIKVGCRPRYYTKPTEDALILRKEWKL